MASVASRNPFALLDDEPSSAPPTKAAAPAATTNTSSQRGNQRGARGRGGPASRGGKYYARGGPRTTGPRETGDEEPTGDEKRRPDGEGRGRGRGRGGRGGGRGDRGGDRGGRRTFDRHSGTGKTDSDKKVHQGWGGDEGNTELRVEQAANTDAQADASAAVVEDNAWGGAAATDDAWGAPTITNDAAAGDNAGDRRNREREPEEPDNTLTLDQYLAQQKEKTAAVPQLETRKVQQDEKLWKDAIAVTRKDEDEDAYFIGKAKSAPKQRTKKEDKVFLEIDARFERPARGGRGGRGERGAGRGPRGGDRRREGGQRNINLEDESAFPSLA